MRLKEIGKLNIYISDGNYSSKYPRNDEFTTEGIPFIRANNFENHTIIDDDLLFISKEKHSILKKGHLKTGDILITTRGNIGNTAIVPERHNDSNINAQIVLLRPDTSINNKYLMLIFQSPEVIKQIEALTTGTALKQLPVGQLRKIKLPIPSLPVQIHIANILTKAENLISQRKESIRLLDEYLKSTFLEMFGDPVRNEKGWEKVDLENLTNKISSGSTPLGGKEVYQRKGKFFIRSQNVRMNFIDYSDMFCISEEIHNNMKRTWLKNDDVLLNITGASIGRVATYFGLNDEANVNQHVCIIRPIKSKLNSRFLEYLISTDHFQKVSIGSSSGGTREAFTFEMIKRFKIILPEIELQTQFAQIVEKTEALKAQYQQSLQELENLYGSLSQRAFKGQLTPKEYKLPNDYAQNSGLGMAAEP